MEIEPPAMDNPDYSVDHADVNQDQELEELVQCGSKKLDKMLFNLSAPELNNHRDLQEMVMKDNGSGATSHDSIIKDSAMEDIALSDHILPIKIDTPFLMPQESEIRSWQDDFMKQIFAVGDGLTQGSVTFFPLSFIVIMDPYRREAITYVGCKRFFILFYI